MKATGSLFEHVETLGLWHPHSMRMLKIIARKTAFHRCQTVSRTLIFLYEQLSVKLWLIYIYIYIYIYPISNRFDTDFGFWRDLSCSFVESSFEGNPLVIDTVSSWYFH